MIFFDYYSLLNELSLLYNGIIPGCPHLCKIVQWYRMDTWDWPIRGTMRLFQLYQMVRDGLLGQTPSQWYMGLSQDVPPVSNGTMVPGRHF